MNEATKAHYKGALNFRVGGELKFTTLMTRLGLRTMAIHTATKKLKGHKMFLSGGLGYRNKGMFIGLTYVQPCRKTSTSLSLVGQG